jgi:4-amino-4-deoxy-L-arabinose transferase-like glycosyltransferase
VSFKRALLLIVVVAFGVRVGYVAFAKSETCKIVVNGEVLGSYPSECAVGDQLFYNTEANALADGQGFVEPLWSLTHGGEAAPPAADHPPLTVLVLAPVSWLVERPPLSWIAGDGLDANVREHRYTMVLFGTALVALVGLLGRRAGGDAVGLVAAGITAVSPNVWVNDGLVMSEAITNCAVVATLLFALMAIERPTRGRLVLFGVGCGVTALGRAELLLVLPLLLVPIVWRRPHVMRHIVTATATTAVVLAPWVVFNLTRFEKPTFLSTNDGQTLAGANCDPAYYGTSMALWVSGGPGECVDDPEPPGDQSEVSQVYRDRAFTYIGDHLERFPLVALARVGRTWSLYRPVDMVRYNVGEGRERWVTRLGLVAFYPTLVAAGAGVVVIFRRHRRRLLAVLLTPVVVVTLTSAATYGQTRFRAAAEPSLAVLAAVAIVAAVRALRSNRPEPVAA